MSEQAEYMEYILSKMEKMVERGDAAMKMIPKFLSEQIPTLDESVILRKLVGEEPTLNRRYTLKQTCEIACVSQTLIITAEQDGRLPPADLKDSARGKVRAGYTINQINRIRKMAGTGPRPRKTPFVLGFPNQKGGVSKTTSVVNFAHYTAIKGHRSLVVDTDPQGSATFSLGFRPDIDVDYADTIAPYILGDDEALIEEGYPPGTSETLDYAVRKTHWDNIDIIPACSQNLSIDALFNQSPVGQSPVSEMYSRLRNGLLNLGEQYDYIILDGTPSLNPTTMNSLIACDAVFVPTPAAMLDFASTIRYLELIKETISAALDKGHEFNIPSVHCFVTKYSRRQYPTLMANAIKQAFKIEEYDVLKTVIEMSDEVQKASSKLLGIYEVNPNQADNRAKLKETVENYDALYDEVMKTIEFIENPYHVENPEEMMFDLEVKDGR